MKPEESAREALMLMPHDVGYTQEHVELFTSVIAPGTPPAITALVYHYSRDLDLDPLRREVMAINTKASDGEGGSVAAWQVIVGVHGMMKSVQRNKDCMGIYSGVVFPGERCVIKADGTVEHEFDIAARSQPKLSDEGQPALLPLGAWCTIVRIAPNGQLIRYTKYLPFHECAQTKWDWNHGGKWNAATKRKEGGVRKKVLRDIWAQRPSWMNEKCAIALTSRVAYAHKLGRVYVAEEFGFLSDKNGAITDVRPEDEKLPSGEQQARLGPMSVDAGITVVTPTQGDAVEVGTLPAKEEPPHEEHVEESKEVELPWDTDPDAMQVADDSLAADLDNIKDRDKLVKNVMDAARRGEPRFREEMPDGRKYTRNFLLTAGVETWVADREVLDSINKMLPTLLSDLTPEELRTVYLTINECVRKKEARQS